MLANIQRRLAGACAALFACIILGLPVASRAEEATAALVPGKYAVNPTGAFNYSIPIKVPPGTAGLVPGLSLVYSSQSGDGLEGLGWSLTGLPSITRCARTLAQDGIHGGINYDSNDRFCFEGQRLITIGTWQSCTGGVLYKTEIDSFSRIVSCGTSGAGPSYFKVWTKSGQIMELGYTADSKAPLIAVAGSTTGPTGTVRAWAVDKVSDAAGNYFNVVYDNGSPDLTTGQVYPTQIDYTANDSQSLTPYNHVKFSYQTRNDQVPVYQAGSVTKNTQLLTHVTTYAGAAVAADYRLSYNFANLGDQHDELSSVKICDAAGTCLPPTAFYWQGTRDRVQLSSNATGFAQSTIGAASPEPIPGDVNGDGLLDVMPKAGAHCGTFLGSLDGLTFTDSGMSTFFQEYEREDTTPPTWVLIGSDVCTSTTGATATTYDFDGDGRSDIIVQAEVQPARPGLVQLHNVGSTFTEIQPLNMGTRQIADFNGDGRSDILFDGGGILYSKGDGTYDNQTLSIGGGLYAVRVPSDFDGDGCADVLTQSKDVHSITYLCNPAIPAVNVNWYLWDAPKHGIGLGDFNGDGKTDILTVSDTDASVLHLSTGTAMDNYTLPQSGWGKYTVVTGDFNGDGKSDVLLVADDLSGKHYSGSAHPHQLWLSTGTGFVQATDANGTIVTLPNNGGSQDLSQYDQVRLGARVSDWNSDGAADIWLQKPSGDVEYLTVFQPEIINRVDNGLNIVTTVTYDRLNKNGALYTKCPGNPGVYFCGDTYPTQGVDGALYVVSRVDTGNGIGGTYAVTFAYGGAKTDLQGRGFLGFQSMTATDPQTNLVTTTVYRTDFPFAGVVTSRTTTHGATVVNAVTSNYASSSQCTAAPYNCVYNVSVQSVTASGSDLDGSPLPSTATAYSNYDAYGNARLTVSMITPPGGGAVDVTKTTTNSYTNVDDASHYLIGELTLSAVETKTAGALGSSDLTRQSGFSYDPATGLLTTEVIEPEAANTSNLKLTTHYGYDAFGNRQTITVTGSGNPAPPACTTTTDYDAKGQFPLDQKNCLNQTESWTYDAPFSQAFGIPHKHTGPNGLPTVWNYDTFGRKVSELRGDGTSVSVAYAWCTAAGGTDTTCPANGAFSIDTNYLGTDGQTQIAPSTRAYTDGLMRGIASDIQGFNGAWIRSDVLFDAGGHKGKTDRSYFLNGGTPQYTTFAYDDLGRMLSATAPDNSVTSSAYHGPSVTVTNARNQSVTTVKNDLGQPAATTDNSGTTTYTYDALSEALTVKDASNRILVTNAYDLRGRRTDMTDADKGHWHYVYDSLNRLTGQTDADGNTVAIGYDLLNRMVSRTEADMSGAWTYDTAAGRGIGQIAAESCTGAACVSGGYSRTYQYDIKGRENRVTDLVGGTSYYSTAVYDTLGGRPTTVRNFSGFSLVHAYNAYGYESEIDDAVNQSLVYWKANARDAELHLISQTAGNGVVTSQGFDSQTGRLLSICATTQSGPCNGAIANLGYDWDTTGNLQDRTDTHALGWQTEQFCYDNMNRLKNASFATLCNGQGSSSVAYVTASGNIRSKSDVGVYTYGTGTGHGDGAGPHAVVSINSCNGCLLNGVANPTFQYDANGNMTSGAGRTLLYTSFNMVSSISEAGGTISNALNYGPNHARVQQTATVNGTATVTTYFNNAAFHEMVELVHAGSKNTWRTYIAVDGKLVALRNGTDMSYFVLDHLGSVSVITDAAGAVPANGRQFFDAWGAMRNADGSADTSCSLPAQSATTRGFTGQEEMASVCLINLNARLYDPVLARFLEADSAVSDPQNGQSYNRYTYVYDDPLAYTDPSGNIETVIVTAALDIDPVVAIVVQAVAVIIESLLDIFAAADPVPTAPVTVAAPTPAQSPAAGGSETSVPQVQNTAAAPADTTTPAPSSGVTADSKAASTPATSYTSTDNGPSVIQMDDENTANGGWTTVGHPPPDWCKAMPVCRFNSNVGLYEGSSDVRDYANQIETVIVEAERCGTWCQISPYVGKVFNAIFDAHTFLSTTFMGGLEEIGAGYGPDVMARGTKWFGWSNQPARLARIITNRAVTNFDGLRLANVAEKFASNPLDQGVFVADAQDVVGKTAEELSHDFTLVTADGAEIEGPHTVITFDTPESGMFNPLSSNSPGFIPSGVTQGGMAEFNLPNMTIDSLDNVGTYVVH